MHFFISFGCLKGEVGGILIKLKLSPNFSIAKFIACFHDFHSGDSAVASFLGLSIENTNLSNLNEDIVKAINLKKIKSKVREKKLKKLINLIVNKGFNLREPDTFYYMSQKASEKSFKTTGEDLYNSLKSELKLTWKYCAIQHL